MGGVRNGKNADSPEVGDTHQRSPAGLSTSAQGTDVPDIVERHRQVATRLLNEGQAARAFGELVRASRTVPMTPRLAAALVAFSLRAGTEAAAIALLSSALGNTQGNTRRAVRLQLARVLRRVNQLPRSIEALQALVEESPGDRRARRLIDAIFRRVSQELTPAEPSEALDPPIVQGRALEEEPKPPEEPTTQEASPRSETVEFSSPWQEDEPTAEAAQPPDARFEPRASSEPFSETRVYGRPVPPSSNRRTSQETSVYGRVPEPPAKELSLRRHMTLEFGALQSTPKADAPTAWSAEEETDPSRAFVPRRENPEETRVEAQLIARQAWGELAQFYLARAEEAKDPAVRADILSRLAEVLENELEDLAGAARAYGQIVALTGDKAALAEQVRLLSQRGDGEEWVVRRVLDEAVQRASNPRARAAAFLARGERLLSSGERARAREDFEAAVAITPNSLPALMGLARCSTGEERAPSAERLRAALAAVPRRTPARMEGLRCLAELAGGPLADARLAHWAWSEVLADSPEDMHAQEQLLGLARQLGDTAGVAQLLRARIAREPRGPVARKARLELVATLEAVGDRDASLAELRQAVRFEPGHKEAWLLLVDRLIALKQSGEAAWAMEHAATATEDDSERLGTWERLARFCRDVLGDAGRAQVYANRAENLRKAITERLSPTLHPEPPRVLKPEPTSGQRTVVLVPPPGGVELTPAPAPVAEPASAPTVLEMPAIGDFQPAWDTKAPGKQDAAPEPPAAPVSVEGTRVIAWEAPPGKLEPARRRARGGSASAPSAPEPSIPVATARPASAPVSESRPAAFERVREHPLDAAAYRELSTFFTSRGDTARGALMAEVASALLGEKDAVPHPPRHTLTPEERAGLRHPGLRNPAGELLASVGLALCRLFPTFGRAAGSSEPLRPDSGPGARVALEVLRSVARLLDVQLPEVFLSEEDGPPFTLVHPGAPRLLVGRLAVRQALPEPELRFFAGRALSCLGPDLLALRCLKKDQLLRAVAILSSVLSGGTDFGPESRVVREALHPKAHERALMLLESAQKDFDAAALADAARHSTNRVGLVACGGPGPAVAALRAYKASEQELMELVRFAASERYLPLRG